MGLLCGRAGRLTDKNGGLRPGQCANLYAFVLGVDYVRDRAAFEAAAAACDLAAPAWAAGAGETDADGNPVEAIDVSAKAASPGRVCHQSLVFI
jgi:hypothetical protein